MPLIMNTINVNPNRFLRHWLMHAIFVWIVSAVASLIAWSPVAILIAVLGQYDSLFFLVNILSTVAILIIPGAVIGYMVGDFQRNLVRDLLGWDLTPWIKYSIMGGVIGGLSVIAGMMLFGTYLPERIQWMITLPLFILPLSACQWWVLRQTTRDAWMWILGNVVAGIVFSGLFFSTQTMPFVLAEPLSSLFTWLIAAGSLGIITGIVMLWLYERPITEFDDNLELARVYVEVHSRDE